MLDDQDVVRLLFRDRELGVLALGVQRVGGDDAPGQVQRPGQRREPGDLVGLAVHPDLAGHSTTALIEGSQQACRLAAGAGMTGAPHRLAVHRDRPPGSPRVSCGPAGARQPRIQPGPGSSIHRVRAGRFQHAADGGLIRRHEPPGQRDHSGRPERPGPAAARPRPIRRPRRTMPLRPAPPPRPPLTTTSGCAAPRADSAAPAPAPGTPPGLGTGPTAARGHRPADVKAVPGRR